MCLFACMPRAGAMDANIKMQEFLLLSTALQHCCESVSYVGSKGEQVGNTSKAQKSQKSSVDFLGWSRQTQHNLYMLC